MKPPLIDRIGIALETSPSEIRNRKQSWEYSRRRAAIANVLKRRTDMSYAAIGKFLGGYDHATMVHGVNLSRESKCPLHIEMVERVEAAI
jgi:chromosomal replication initiation ATPase DnaA